MANPGGSLWEALGRPPAGLPLPASRTDSWAAAREQLEAGLREGGCALRVRSAGTLWGAAQGGSAPRGATWGDLCRGKTLQGVRRSLEAVRAPARASVSLRGT